MSMSILIRANVEYWDRLIEGMRKAGLQEE